MMRFFNVIPGIVLMFITVEISAQSNGKMTREDYMRTYKDVAISEMSRSGIPASITLAQGMLESDNGNSHLARQGNNHFGIKCHGWTGKEIFHDDDHKDECFRKYKSAQESYSDHTEFLMNSPRYGFLFYLNPDDYRGWARGLEKAGYATSRTYSADLIRIIEENKLYMYDRPQQKKKKKGKATGPENEADLMLPDTGKTSQEVPYPTEIDSALTAEVGTMERKILTRNRIEYIIVKEGDTYSGLIKELNLMPFELARYNEMERNASLTPGQVLYLQPKRNKASVEFQYHRVAEGETMYQISQMYGIKLHILYEKNQMKEGTEPSAGDLISLRKPKKGETTEEVDEIPEEQEELKIIFD